MTTSFKHSASIEEFLANEMAPAEQVAFIKEIKSNPDLAEEMKLSQNIEAAISREGEIDLRKKLVRAIETGRGVKSEVKVVRINTRKWWYAAASMVAVFACAGVLYFQVNHSLSNDSLFSQYYNSENVVDLTRGDQNIVEAVIKFQQKDFKTAAELFKNILDKDNSNIAVWFYYGISNIETNNSNAAINAFNTIIKQNDNLYIEHAEWYLGLCYLKDNQKDKAIDQFLIVANNPDNYHHQEAKNILEKLQLK
ncbi:MAG: tetratricopeptide repeat protein [Bacteroidota bacterium]